MAKDDLTAEQLREQLHYDQDTGVFTWLASNRIGINGNTAGYIHKRYGYRYIKVNTVAYRAARLVFLFVTGDWPPHHIDHINHDRADDRWLNLRPVTSAENARNQSRRVNNSSGVLGVSRHIPLDKWHARIGINGRVRHLGYFDNFDDAVRARRAAEIRHDFHENHGREKV